MASYSDDLAVVRRALIRRYHDGQDVGEFLVEAVAAAQQQLARDDSYRRLTDNRPGSWEAALVDQILTGAGIS